jgi:hypothetical protein
VSERLKSSLEFMAEQTLWFRIKWAIDHFFGRIRGVDPNFNWSEREALRLCPELDCRRKALECVDLVEAVEALVLPEVMARGGEAWRDAPRLLGFDAASTGIVIMFWNGCLDAAKCIAIGTGSGRNWPWLRRRWAKHIEAKCAMFDGYARGVVAAVAFKRGRGEPISFLGIPRNSLIRCGLDAYTRATADPRLVTSSDAEEALGP